SQQLATRGQRASSSTDTCCTPTPSTRAWTAAYGVPDCHCEPAEHRSAGTATLERHFADTLAVRLRLPLSRRDHQKDNQKDNAPQLLPLTRIAEDRPLERV
ncbi:hypothetical protein PF010_g32680, partial [Phytophthora fragariae]